MQNLLSYVNINYKIKILSELQSLLQELDRAKCMNFSHFFKAQAKCFLSSVFLTMATFSITPLQASAVEEGMKANLEPGAVTFTPPTGWRLADPSSLPSSVKVMVVGKTKGEYPPSINLATEEFSGTLKQYLKIVKNINESQKAEWKDLGFIKTDAGQASLSQVDSKTNWGTVRLMHVILVKNGLAYILTAASLKDEFSQFYKDFFNSLKSLQINPNAFEMIKDPKQRMSLRQEVDKLKDHFKELADNSELKNKVQIFESKEFQTKYWEPFMTMLQKQYVNMTDEWHKHFVYLVQKNLTETVTN